MSRRAEWKQRRDVEFGEYREEKKGEREGKKNAGSAADGGTKQKSGRRSLVSARSRMARHASVRSALRLEMHNCLSIFREAHLLDTGYS